MEEMKLVRRSADLDSTDTEDGAPGLGRTLIGWFWDDVDRHPERVALRYQKAGQWRSLTWRAYGEAVTAVAEGLRSLGVGPGDRVALFGDNRPEWHIADLSIMALGAICVPIYQTSAPAQVVHVITDSGASVLIADTAERGRIVAALRPDTTGLSHLVVIDPGDETGEPGEPWDHTWHDLTLAGTERRRGNAQESRIDETSGKDIATIVYTSGTTGPAKGVTLTHDNISFTVTSVASLVGVGPTDRMLSFLPLSHIAERAVSHFGHILGGGETWFASSLATVADDLHQCRPTIFFAVPRVWQKMHDSIVAGVGETGARRRLFDCFAAVGQTRLDEEPSNVVARTARSIKWTLLDIVVGRRIRRTLGLDAARHLVSGAAPVDPELLGWFHAIGLPIGQAYGQTEDCGPATLATRSMLEGRRDRLGSSGRPIPGLQIRTLPDGELLVRGASVCHGYWRNPEATHDLIDSEGWMHTGDLGRVDTDGLVWVTGRKKELIINAAGHNVAPLPIETALGSEPLIQHAIVVGDARPYLSALVTIDPDELTTWAHRHNRLVDLAIHAGDPELRAAVFASIARVNAQLARSEQIRRFRILPEPLSLARDELTPTMKVKRAMVMGRYAALVDEMYRSDE